MQQKLVDMATELEAARQLVYKAAWEKDQGRDFARTAAMAKLFSGELSHRAANWALQIHGGYGFMDEYPISRLYRDQKILEIGEGTNEVQRMVIARHLGLGTLTAAAGVGNGRGICSPSPRRRCALAPPRRARPVRRLARVRAVPPRARRAAPAARRRRATSSSTPAQEARLRAVPKAKRTAATNACFHVPEAA